MTDYGNNAYLARISMSLDRIADALERAYPTPVMLDRNFTESVTTRPREVEQKDWDGNTQSTELPPYGIGKQPGAKGWN
jgi:hypothetical protein